MFEKKWDFDAPPFFFKLKSDICDEFLFFCLNSFWKRASLLPKNWGENVISLLSEITWKYGTEIESPWELELLIFGIKKPDCLLTVGSGWKNFGK